MPTASEEYLAKLCGRAFLSLWAHPHVYTDEGRKNNKGVGKELCDLLVIFGDDVLIISDKHIEFKATEKLDVGWSRWYRSAIEKSVRQLIGAASFIERFPDRLFANPECTTPLPVKLPATASMRLHLIAVTRGSYEPCAKHFGGNSRGSLRITNQTVGANNPFTVGRVDSRRFVHVFDEFSLDVLMYELDTAPDLNNYLRRREILLGRDNVTILADGEEELLALFVRNMGEHGGHDFPGDLRSAPAGASIYVQEGHWDSLMTNPRYAAKQQANRISYTWDKLIERYITRGDANAVPGVPLALQSEPEPGLRRMAATDRTRRRLLAEVFFEAMEKPGPGGTFARCMPSTSDPDTVWVFLVASSSGFDSYDEYRRNRMMQLAARGHVARLQAPDALWVVGIAIDNPHDDAGSSEDFYCSYEPTFTQEMRIQAERVQQEFGFWLPANVTRAAVHSDEYPQQQNRREMFVAKGRAIWWRIVDAFAALRRFFISAYRRYISRT